MGKNEQLHEWPPSWAKLKSEGRIFVQPDGLLPNFHRPEPWPRAGNATLIGFGWRFAGYPVIYGRIFHGW
jgi:hypothetical protein